MSNEPTGGPIRPFVVPANLWARNSRERLVRAFASNDFKLKCLTFDIIKGRGSAHMGASACAAIESAAYPMVPLDLRELEESCPGSDTDAVGKAMLAIYDLGPMLADAVDRDETSLLSDSYDDEQWVCLSFFPSSVIAYTPDIEWMPSLDYSGREAELESAYVRSRICTIYAPPPASNHERLTLWERLNADLDAWRDLQREALADLPRLHRAHIPDLRAEDLKDVITVP